MDPITIEEALEKKCKNTSWLLWILFLTASPTIFNASHLASYVFLGGNPSFSCNVPELVETNWTKEQIRAISNPGLDKQSCVYYAWNYTLLKDIGFDEALRYYNETEKPDLLKCNSYIYDEQSFHQSIISEWDLVCDNMNLRSTAQGSVAVGKSFGALVFGMISDRFGRKKTFIFSSILFMIAGPSVALSKSVLMFIVFRVLTGVASAGLFETAYTILMEITVKDYKTVVGNLFNLAYSFGLILLPLAAYYTNNWRQLQLAISVPMFALVIHCWFLPESPRWLVTNGKLKKSPIIIGSVDRLVFNEPHLSRRSDTKGKSDSCSINMLGFFKDYLKLFSTLELFKRTIICTYLWFCFYLYYFIVALSGSNFDFDVYLYMGLNGIIDMPGLLLPIFILSYFGRKSSGITFTIISGIALIVIPVLPQGVLFSSLGVFHKALNYFDSKTRAAIASMVALCANCKLRSWQSKIKKCNSSWPTICMALLGRLVGLAACAVIMIQTVELFPTENRNTAVGCCTTSAQLGPLLAPFIVEILGKKIWWMPTVLCGLLALLGGFLMMFIPETRGTPMLDTIKDMKKHEIKDSSKESEQIEREALSKYSGRHN